jgi:hypothetical protein
MSSDINQIRDEVKDIEGGGLRLDNPAGGGRRQQTQGRLMGLYDVNTHNPNVQQEVLRYLKRCIELGASGFRYDAVFHIELPDEEEDIRSDFWPVVLNNGAEERFTNPTGDMSLLMIERGAAGAVIINAGAKTDLESVAVLLTDGSYTDLISGNVFTVADGKLSGTVNAESVAVFYKEGHLSVHLTPRSGDFYTDTLELTLSAVNATASHYSLNGGDPVPFTNGQTLMIGAGLRFDEEVTITLIAEGYMAAVTRDYTFTKREPQTVEGETVVYFNNTEDWDEVHCYVYVPAFGGVAENASWPGLPMTHMGGSLWVYVLPEEFEENMHVMFNNNAGSQFPAPNAPGLVMNKGQRMILEGVQLVPYDSPGS